MKTITVYKSGIHLGEERLLQGNHNSGMINFSGCHLSCSFCYTPETSARGEGAELSSLQFYSLLEELITRGARNLNLISPSHVWKQIKSPLSTIKSKYSLPIILKTSGYESPLLVQSFLTLSQLFVPDFKVSSEESATKVGLPKNYGSVAQTSIKVLIDRLGPPRMNESGMLYRGVLVRHLLMPGFFEDSIRVVESLAEIEFKGHINFMTYFVEPNEKRVTNANPSEVSLLAALASSSGMNVLVNGKSHHFHHTMDSTSGTHLEARVLG